MRLMGDPIAHPEQAYIIEDGIYVDPEIKPNHRRFQSTREQLAEEQRWRAQSGPCYTISPGRNPA